MTVPVAESGSSSLSVHREQLESIFHLKYGSLSTTGWGPRMRWQAGHFNPDDHYEALVERLIEPGCRWLDVGCGRSLFPSNERLARLLAGRCGLLVGLDPDPTLAENPFVHERVHLPIEEFQTTRPFQVITLRMVAEHVQHPREFSRSLARCLAPGGRVVVYTVNRFSPVPLITSVVPFGLHNPAKRVLWGTEEKDTFPTFFRMNTRRRLKEVLESAGFRELFFTYLDDCRTTSGFRPLQRLELALWRAMQSLGWRYPENCLLGVYELSRAGVTAREPAPARD